ncbi:hypothetical protein V6D40_08655 [Corynebacterium sp. Q4381]|uniref:hypothetical protein n=1 Tax=Corynebacterium sp. Marseille-Q4381 TaxID=3121597 RepID=UPI002FE634BD
MKLQNPKFAIGITTLAVFISVAFIVAFGRTYVILFLLSMVLLASSVKSALAQAETPSRPSH